MNKKMQVKMLDFYDTSEKGHSHSPKKRLKISNLQEVHIFVLKNCSFRKALLVSSSWLDEPALGKRKELDI